MNKHIAKLREQLVKDMDRLTAELADVANAINAVDGLGAVQDKASDGRRAAWTPERRAEMSAKMKARHSRDPDAAREAMARARQALAEQRANGAAGEWHA